MKVGKDTTAPASSLVGEQHLIINAVEFDHRHKNWYGYMAFGAFVLVLINYLMIENRSCQITFVGGAKTFDLIQGFHMTTLIVAIILFVLSYFNFAVIIYDFKLLFYTAALLIFVCVGMLIYDVVAITSAPCKPITNTGFLSLIGFQPNSNETIFSVNDGVGITVFLFDIFAAGLMFFAGRNFYQRS